ncbi:hypothetical protein BaRGS_00040220, partial [Batillaria attramentaria]
SDSARWKINHECARPPTCELGVVVSIPVDHVLDPGQESQPIMWTAPVTCDESPLCWSPSCCAKSCGNHVHPTCLSRADAERGAAAGGLQGVAHGQNYHYSNGWHPGKRSRPLAASLFRASMGVSSDDACSFRPQVIVAMNNIVQ